MPLPSLTASHDALDLAEWLASQMPTGENTDKRVWIADMAVVFTSYPRRDVELAVKHPLKGLRASHRWLPSIPDVIEFLQAQSMRRGRILRNAKLIVERHDERARDAAIETVSAERRAEITKAALRKFPREGEQQVQVMTEAQLHAHIAAMAAADPRNRKEEDAA